MSLVDAPGTPHPAFPLRNEPVYRGAPVLRRTEIHKLIAVSAYPESASRQFFDYFALARNRTPALFVGTDR